MKKLSEKEEALKVGKGTIELLEGLFSSEDPTPCKITIKIEDTNEEYSIPKGTYLRDHPDEVRRVMDKIRSYRRAYGKEETQKQLDNAPILYSELIIAGQGKELEHILNNAA